MVVMPRDFLLFIFQNLGREIVHVLLAQARDRKEALIIRPEIEIIGLVGCPVAADSRLRRFVVLAISLGCLAIAFLENIAAIDGRHYSAASGIYANATLRPLL